ncbi:MAG: aminoglycoside phosphotransferase family protein [Christensenellaceae bacterium]|jgi:tRNA A-37 threonylcarbamoyl transferase component Bud32|nr:aminoglycoside phosphotransferase family protein [Christensenellaceae bacterium]
MEWNVEKVLAKRANKLIYKSGNFRVKLFGSEFSKSDILNEALNHARVEATDLNIPKIEEVTKIKDQWAIICEYIPGTTLDNLMIDYSEMLDKYLDLFIDIQLEMHSKTVPLLNNIKDKMNRKISASGLPATTRYELHTRLDSMPKHNKLCHGDFNPSNIIVGDDGKCYIIDWSHATVGNASADAARTYLLFSLEKRRALADKYLTKFCLKSDTAKQYVQKWMPIVAASQLVKGRPEEKEFLSSWVHIMDE